MNRNKTLYLLILVLALTLGVSIVALGVHNVSSHQQSSDTVFVTNTTTASIHNTTTITSTYNNTITTTTTINKTIGNQELSKRLLNVYKIKIVLDNRFYGVEGSIEHFEWTRSNWYELYNITKREDAYAVYEALGEIITVYNDTSPEAGETRAIALDVWFSARYNFFVWYNDEIWIVVLEAGVLLNEQ